MKNNISFLSLFFLFSSMPIMEAQSQYKAIWGSLLNDPAMVRYFNGVFETLGVIVMPEGEAFTVHQAETGFTITEDIATTCDYVVKIDAKNVSNLVSHAQDGTVSADESYEIIKVLFTPLTAQALQHPCLSKPLMRALSGIEKKMLVHLKDPNSTSVVSHSLQYEKRKWQVSEGVCSDAQRTFTLTPDQAILFQRKLFNAVKLDTAKEWKAFRKWYLGWREDVSVTQ